MSPLTIKILTAGGLIGLYYFVKSSPASADVAPVPQPGPAPQPGPVPIPRGVPDRVNPDVFPVDQFNGPGYPVRRRRYGWPWY